MTLHVNMARPDSISAWILLHSLIPYPEGFGKSSLLLYWGYFSSAFHLITLDIYWPRSKIIWCPIYDRLYFSSWLYPILSYPILSYPILSYLSYSVALIFFSQRSEISGVPYEERKGMYHLDQQNTLKETPSGF